MANRVCPTCGVMLPSDAPEALCPRCLMQAGFNSPTASGRPAFTPPSVAELSPHFPQLEIFGLIGQGGMGAVYKARQLKLDRLVALKVLPNGSDSDPAFAERFSREARALARMQHPHIVSVHDFGDAGSHYYLLLEYVDGMNLRELMRAGRVPEDQAVRVIQALADALQYAHQNEIIHRDIKPENVLIDRQGRVKIADFGLAKLAGLDPAGYTLTGASEAMGTPHYMAPEQLERPKEVDRRADLYSLGVLSYELLTGELPLGRFDPPSAKAGCDPRLDEIVMKCLERDPARRFQSAAEIQAALEALESTPASSIRSETERPTAPPRTTRAPAEPTAPYEPLSVLGLIAFAAAVVIGIRITKSPWLALGLLGVQQMAAAINWRPQIRPVIGIILVLAGVSATAMVLVWSLETWWLILVIWFWYGDRVYRYFKPYPIVEPPAALVSLRTSFWDRLSTREKAVVAAIWSYEKQLNLLSPMKISGAAMEQIRQERELPPSESVLAAVLLSGDDDPANALVFGSQSVYFPGMRYDRLIKCRQPYEALPYREFVNHGRSVYIGDHTAMPIESEEVPGEAVAQLLNSVAKAVELVDEDVEA